MKYVILSALLITGCSQAGEERKTETAQSKEPSRFSIVRIVKIRGCEYLESSASQNLNAYNYEHCGDCNNPIHNHPLTGIVNK